MSVYIPQQTEPFVLSRSKIELFIQCPRCFYLDRRLGVSRPQGFPFTLNTAVDILLKKEFDIHRKAKTTHPYMAEAGISAIPFDHIDMRVWRENFTGARATHAETGFIVQGAVDDIWIHTDGVDTGKLILVDYKSTSKEGDVSLDAAWQDGYKRQLEIYQWIFRSMGFEVSDVGYFVYVNGLRNVDTFDKKLNFSVTLLPYSGDCDWVETTLRRIKTCLDDERVPKETEDCEYCRYRTQAGVSLKTHIDLQSKKE